MLFRPVFLGLAFGVSSLLPASAQESVTLRLHHFLSPMATVPHEVLEPWVKEIEAESAGRLKIELYDSMVLGGKPADLYDQVKDGVVDIVLTLPGYTPGRFPRTEVFELPFFVSDPEKASAAFMSLVTSDFATTEYAGVKMLGAWVHGPGVIHALDPVTKLEDMAGRDFRAPTRLAAEMLKALGANPVGMPLPAVPENLTKGVISGAMIPWEVTPSVKIAELVNNHTELAGPEALYTATLILVMNEASYAALPDDLRAILDKHTGVEFSKTASRVELEGDDPARKIAVDNGNSILTLDATESARWKALADPILAQWIIDREAEGIDAKALLDHAKTLMAP